MTLIIAHRGSAGTHPENTMDAFIAAEKYGADGIELDVQLSLDGEVVVIHDTTLDRTTNGTGKVKDFTLAELKQLKANCHYKHFFKRASRIPTLREVFEWMKCNKLSCNIELKNNDIPYEGLEEKVIGLIKEFGLEKRIVISSFNHQSLLRIKRIAPTIETAPLYKRKITKPWEYAWSLQCSGIHPKLVSISLSDIQAAMEAGVAVRPYTINSIRDMKKLLAIGCTAIITDYPKKAKKLQKEWLNKCGIA
ncbi:glycerophosphodiester phosphodiesterase [Bacillus sp. FJAT-50079]|uniref:glycerophosphodiester phosphodiesterase n=1 Tax=Bacillus sp. FJAT-50079 TaxID=2833577 RepID=UPI001BC9F185|nr:glycerophosphodiester phosphodiesterase [Bacillus sp. FJAT-50079]MBS4209655.1 glycerophosphodiester phosphodiesterase [Bacillus sp. FJAT-50079]